VVLETLKPFEEDGLSTNTFIMRLYESVGGRGAVRIRSSSSSSSSGDGGGTKTPRRVVRCNLLEEEEGEDLVWTAEEGLVLVFHPFEIVSLKVVWA